MKCMFCQGNMTRGAAPLHIDRQGVHIHLDKVPAWVCGQCGESYFEEGEIDAVQAIVKTVDEQAGKLTQTA